MASFPRRARRGLHATVAALCGGALLGTGLLGPLAAHAAPAPVTADSSRDMTITHEVAVISVRGQTERVDMRLTLNSAVTSAGIIIPTPAPATLTLASIGEFDVIAREVVPQTATTRDWWTPNWSIWPSTARGLAPSSLAARTVMTDVDVPMLDAPLSLAANDADGLSVWLTENALTVRANVATQLAKYAEAGWYFTAIKLNSKDILSGNLPPITLSFDLPATGPVYPLAISAASRLPTTVDLYVFGGHRSHVTFADGHFMTAQNGAEPTWAGPVRQQSLLTYGSYLTAFSLYFSQPGQQILGDLVFPRARTDDTIGVVVTQTEYMNVFGFPVGWWAIAAAFAFVAAIIRLLIRQRERRRQGVLMSSGG